MIRFRKLISKAILVKLYKAFILLHFQYCSSVWHFCSVRNTEKLDAEAEAPLNENFGGLSPPRFAPENIGSGAENWFGKIFRLVIFSQIVSQWSRLAKYHFLGLFEQLHPDFEKPINCYLFSISL